MSVSELSELSLSRMAIEHPELSDSPLAFGPIDADYGSDGSQSDPADAFDPLPPSLLSDLPGRDWTPSSEPRRPSTPQDILSDEYEETSEQDEAPAPVSSHTSVG